jgi:bifunctional DNA-binding transcriptional regulator/antitoxin component of YhaV-PrlF toxin-antitoxin module
MSKVVKTQSKGMVTIPVEYREKLGIEANSLLKAELTDNGVMFVKINYEPEKNEIYTDKQIKEWMKEDKLDAQTAKKLKKLLKT